MNDEIDVLFSFIENGMIPLSFDSSAYDLDMINKCENNLLDQRSFEDDAVFEEFVMVTRLNCIFEE